MYLKRIELHGFKSFADKVVLDLTKGITGIVGPNGCGKSNITDAIRFVLGEQSVKSMRGNSMTDVIFAGSEDRKAQGVAEVTLVFDNQDRFIKKDYNEIEITRRIYRHNNEGEYLLNKQHCRLKDIIDLMMDTGLGRDSLSMISQGNISSFADSKPEERRLMFEEASGVSKYKKRKIESLRKLEKANDNLTRIQDIVYELEKQIEPLKKQSDKAQIYLNYKEELKNIEVSLVTATIKDLKDQYENTEIKIKELEQREASINATISNLELKEQNLNHLSSAIDEEIDTLQQDLLNTSEEEKLLSKEQIELSQKRQSILDSNSQASLQEKIESILALGKSATTEYNTKVELFEQMTNKLNDVIQNKNKLVQKQRGLKDLLDKSIANHSSNKAKAMIIQEQIDSNSNYNYGVKTILNSSLEGIIDVVEKVIEPHTGYENAISNALAGASSNILTSSQYHARLAVDYLKKNKAGRATFLPIDKLSARTIRDDHQLVLDTIDGYIGKASDFVSYDKKYELVVSNLLGNVLLAKDLKTANEIANKTYYRYKVVTLNGDISNVGGSITGGSSNKNQSLFVLKKQLEDLNKEVESNWQNNINLRSQIDTLENELTLLNSEIMQQRIVISKEEDEITAKLNQIQSLKREYATLKQEKSDIDEVIGNGEDDVLVKELAKLSYRKNEITSSIKAKRETRLEYKNAIDDLQTEIRENRSELRNIMNELMDLRVSFTSYDHELTQQMNYLTSEYMMTYEHALTLANDIQNVEDAKNQVFIIKTNIKKLGNINLDAIEQYQERLTRYEFMNKQKQDLETSAKILLDAIDEMDTIMKKNFDETFQKINVEFNHVFRQLFGGGKAIVKYSDPTNILETGIDIDVQPPGKSVQNITLFSGGEKALIAISCLFAILKVRPVPLCILDEVEAALDQANVERFAKFLKEFTGTTQFLVVTHRPGTMEQCDVLYGATMQEKGVTKLISVLLEDAIKEIN